MSIKHGGIRPFRDSSIDSLRGLAIVGMLGANLASATAWDHSLLFRYFCSFPAPIFVMLSGAMVGLSALNPKPERGFHYFLMRGLFLIAIGTLVDIAAWHIVPLLGMDVLYLIGVSLPLVCLISSFSLRTTLVIALALFALTFIAQHIIGYTKNVTYISLENLHLLTGVELKKIVQHVFLDGWFPFLPWFGYSVAGLALSKWRWKPDGSIRSFASPAYGAVGFSLVLTGLFMTQLSSTPAHIRENFLEMFYPPTAGFVLFSLGLTLLLITLIDSIQVLKHNQFLALFGEASLFMYIAHSLMIGRLYEPFGPLAIMQTQTEYWLAYAAMVFLLFICGTWLKKWRKSHPQAPVAVKWVLGSIPTFIQTLL